MMKLLIYTIIFILSSTVFVSGADFTIDSATTSTNGGNTINGDDSLTITSSGSITVTGGNIAISSTNNSNTFTLDGDITAAADGIYIRNGDSNTITVNSGSTITTGETDGSTMYSIWHNGGDSNIINVHGAIISKSRGAECIHLRGGSNNTVNFTGTCTNLDESGNEEQNWGITFQGNGSTPDNNQFTHTGTVKTSGSKAVGVMIDYKSEGGTFNIGGSTIVENTGSGQTIAGAFLSGNDNIYNFSGKVKATGAQNNYGILINGHTSTTAQNNTINFNKGTIIIGDIRTSKDSGNIARSTQTAAKDTTLNFNLGKEVSYSYKLTSATANDWNIRNLNGIHYTADSSSTSAMSTGSIETAGLTLYNRTSNISKILNKRSDTYTENTNKSSFFEYYIGNMDQTSSTDRIGFDNRTQGFLFTYPNNINNKTSEVIFHYETGSLNLDKQHTINSTAYNIGLLFPQMYKIGKGYIHSKFLLGRVKNKGDRAVLDNTSTSGINQTDSKYTSDNLMLGINYSVPLKNTSFNYGIDLNTQYTPSYKEGSYFTHQDRTFTQLQSYIDLSSNFNLKENIFFEIGTGIEYRDILAGNEQKYKINTSSFTHKDIDNSTFVNLETSLTRTISDKLSFYLNLNTTRSVHTQTFKGGIGFKGFF